jgi:hypothetical protein
MILGDKGFLREIGEAAARIEPYVVRTPYLKDRLFGFRLLVEPKGLQKTGSLKARGLLTLFCSTLRSRTGSPPSSGNHAQGLAYASRIVGATTGARSYGCYHAQRKILSSSTLLHDSTIPTPWPIKERLGSRSAWMSFRRKPQLMPLCADGRRVLESHDY